MADPSTPPPSQRKVIGDNRVRFTSFVALLGRSKVSILIDKWDHVPEEVKNKIWQTIMTDLTSRYIHGKLSHKNPCEIYQFLDEEVWQAFQDKRLDPTFQMVLRNEFKKELFPQLRDELLSEIKSEIASLGLTIQGPAKGAPPVGASTKGSCPLPEESGDGVDVPVDCELYVDDPPGHLVALGGGDYWRKATKLIIRSFR
ncbi:hypothetical protein V8G54_003412 [Vigna mungo]|uniref:Uncharacterized protein n=1 Tax=Vigna mungo TaxID=3915 RepID=A0AAQ3PAW2_VIGMU